jgi:hypothetical protein
MLVKLIDQPKLAFYKEQFESAVALNNKKWLKIKTST